MTIEEWRPVAGFDGRYEVSDAGRIRVSGPNKDGRRCHIGKIVRMQKNRYGYADYVLWESGRAKHLAAHNAVALAFLGPRPPGAVINHKNGNKADARVDNIEYVSRSRNHCHALENGLFVPPYGMRHWNVKLTDCQVLEIIARVDRGESQRSVARDIGCCQQHISNICAGKSRASLIQ